MTYIEAPDTTLTITADARETIADMHSRVALIADKFGDDSPEHRKAASSLARVLSRLMGRGTGRDVRVMRDGKLSLLVSEDGGAYVYGIIFFRDRGAADRMLTRHGHDPADPAMADALAQFADLAGDWSTHS